MIQQITWQTFLVATLVLTVIWYVAIVLLFYRRELFHVLESGQLENVNQFRRTEALPHRWEKGVEELSGGADAEELELMGKSKLPEGMMMVDSGGFGFAGGEDAREEQVGLVPDVLAEIRSLFAELARNDLGKRDFLEMMASVRKSFPKIASNPNIGRINEFIAEHAPFHLSAEELENLWD